MKPKKRILFFAEAVTLAHTARCVALAQKLHPEYEIGLASSDRYDAVLGQLPFQRFPLYSVPSDFFFDKLSKGSPIYDKKTLCRYVEDDFALMDDFKPDFIFGDFRLSLAISSKKRDIPYATITNAYWSPYTNFRYPIPELPLTKIFGVALAEQVFNWVKPIVFKMHAVAMNRAARHYGVSIPLDIRTTYTLADYTLYADIEPLIPMQPLPPHHHFIGPVLWSADVPIPAWWDDIPTDNPIVYVTMGSSGNSALLSMVLEALAQEPITLLCVTAGQTKAETNQDRTYIADFLPAEEAVRKADIVVCNGGSPSVYQGLLAAKPVLGLPRNLDQYLMMSLIEKAGVGRLIRSGQASPGKIRDAINSLLSLNRDILQHFTPFQLDLEKIKRIITSSISH